MMTTILLIALQTVLIAGGGLTYISGQNPERLDQGAQFQDSSDAAMKAFVDARNLIKDGEWARAEQGFNRFITGFPKDRDVAAAHYYLAFALKQQNRFQEADKWLIQLIEKFPESSWVTDAKAMRVELAPRLNNKKVIEQAVSAENDEIKLAALQSLFEAKPERAIALAAEILKRGSGASRLMREGAIALLADSDSKQAIPVLIDVALNETDHELHKKAVRALGDRDDESVLDPLKALIVQSADKEIARIAIRALAEHEGPRAQALLIEVARSNADMELRATAIKGLGERGQDTVVNELLKLFASDRNEIIRKAILSALSEIDLPSAQAAILEMARAADSAELRNKAIHALADQGGEKAVDILIQFYDTEKDERTREVILNALGDSEQKKALKKLMDIVEREPSLKLKKKALAKIGESGDPEAMKFLEKLLKKTGLSVPRAVASEAPQSDLFRERRSLPLAVLKKGSDDEKPAITIITARRLYLRKCALHGFNRNGLAKPEFYQCGRAGSEVQVGSGDQSRPFATEKILGGVYLRCQTWNRIRRGDHRLRRIHDGH